MAKIIDIARKLTYPLREHSHYTTIGRHPKADIVLPPEFYSPHISRFHATVITHLGERYLLDHSFNGTYYPVERAGTIDPSTRVATAFSTKEFANYKGKMHEKWFLSQRLADTEQAGEQVPRMPGYVEHGFADIDDVEYLLRMIEDPDQRELLLPAARKMATETILAITPDHRFLFLM